MQRSTSTTSWTTVRGRWPSCEPRRRHCPPGVVQGLVHASAKLPSLATSWATRMRIQGKGRTKAKEQKFPGTASHRPTVSRGTYYWNRSAVAENQSPGYCSEAAQAEDGHWHYTAQAARRWTRCLS